MLLLLVEGDGVDPGEELLQVGLDHGRAGGLGSKDRCATNVYLLAKLPAYPFVLPNKLRKILANLASLDSLVRTAA